MVTVRRQQADASAYTTDTAVDAPDTTMATSRPFTGQWGPAMSGTWTQQATGLISIENLILQGYDRTHWTLSCEVCTSTAVD
jgi:hypothetical protein